jgi:hypothetical protein
MKRPAAPDDPRPDRDLLEDPDLIEFTERLPEARKVSVSVMNQASGGWRHKGSMNKDSFNLDNVQAKFGGGTYRFSIHAADGKLLKTISNIEIDDLADDDREPEAKTAAVAPAAVSEIQLLREQMSADRLLIMELVRSRNSAPPQSDITQLVAALATLKGMEPKHEPQPAIQDLMMKSMLQGLELAQKVQKSGGSGDASPLGEILGFARELFQDARPIIQAAIANAVPPGTVRPGTTISGDEVEDDTEIDLKPALQHVKEQLRSGMPPNTLAHLVLAQMQANPELDETLSALISEQPIESFLELDAELKEEPLRTTFGKFFGEMRARILQVRDSRGSGGNPENAGDHAGTDTRIR